MTSRQHLVEAVAGLSRVMSFAPETHELAAPAFLLLTEALVEVEREALPPLPLLRRQRMERLVQLERQMSEQVPSERASAITERLGIGRSYYYALRADAISHGLIPVVHKKSTESASQ